MKSGGKAGNDARDVGAAILLVDDNKLVATALARYLGVWGYEVTVAYSVVDAGEILRDGRHFDVVILDPLFPRERGEDLLKDIPRELPVVIFSANPERVTVTAQGS